MTALLAERADWCLQQIRTQGSKLFRNNQVNYKLFWNKKANCFDNVYQVALFCMFACIRYGEFAVYLLAQAHWSCCLIFMQTYISYRSLDAAYRWSPPSVSICLIKDLLFENIVSVDSEYCFHSYVYSLVSKHEVMTGDWELAKIWCTRSLPLLCQRHVVSW